MAITFSTPFSSAAFTSGGVTLTQSYTVPSGADELWLFGYVDNANVTVPLPDIMAYGGLSATLVAQIPSNAGGTGQLHFFYRILNPVVGTANITARHPTLSIAVGAVCLVVDQNYIMTYSAFNYANSTSPTVTITSASGDKTLYSLTVNNVDTTAVSETGGQTVLSEGGSSIAAMHQMSSETSAGSSNTATWTVSGAQRWSAIAINVHEIAQSIDTLTSPLVPGQAFSGTSTGYANGAAVLAMGSISVAVTIASGAFSGTFPMLSDNSQWPRLPATAQTVSLTQGADVSTIARDISLPTGYDVVRDGSNVPANFANLVADDDTYLQPDFIAAGNPLTTSDTAYHVTSANYLVEQSSKVGADTSSLPRTDTLFVHRASGYVYEHEVTLNNAGEIVDVSGLSVVGLSSTGLSVAGLSVTGL